MAKDTSPVETVSAATLLAWRERMGFSAREACQQLGCSRGAWSVWESGKQPVPRYIGLACAALALGMTTYGSRPKEENAA